MKEIGTQDRWDAGCGMQDRRENWKDAGQEGYRTGRMQDRGDAGKEEDTDVKGT